MSLITFVLTQKSPTSYQKSDLTFYDTPVSKRILPKYSRIEQVLDKDGKVLSSTIVKHRYIRTENSTKVSEQKNTSPSAEGDNLYFSNGLLVLDEVRDANAIEFIRNHPSNEEQPSFQRRQGVKVKFKEAKPEKEGRTAMGKFLATKEAENAVLALQKGNDTDGYTYNLSKLNLLAKAFSSEVDASDVPEQQIIQLLKVAQKRPDEFLYTINTQWGEVENEIDIAIKLDVLKVDKHRAYLGKDMIVESVPALNATEMKYEVIAYLLSPRGNSHYVDMKDIVANAGRSSFENQREVVV